MMESLTKKNRILIYGTGEIAKRSIRKFEDNGYSIKGIIDRFRIGGEFEGYKILEWRDIYCGYAEKVIIAAPQHYYQEIYSRIYPYCKSRGMEICGAYGQRLDGLLHECEVNDARRFTGSADDLYELILRYSAISFDIFDTLLMRRVSDPTDVFRLVERKARVYGIIIPEFHKKRREAEIQSQGADIYTIYRVLQVNCNLTDEQRDKLQDLEFECEKRVLIPRKDMLYIVKELCNQQKRLFYTSDMYFTASQLNELLISNGFPEPYKIIVSCEYESQKKNGLYRYLKNNLEDERCIHIGDDRDSDFEAAREFGIDSIWLYSGMDSLRRGCLRETIGHANDLNTGLLLGETIGLMYNSPFDNSVNNVLKISDIDELAVLYLLPVVVAYFKGLILQLSKKKYSGVLFAARDGYFFQKLYEKLKAFGIIEGPDSFYIPCSRKLSIRVGTEKTEDIQRILRFYNVDNKRELLQSVFGVEISQSELKKTEISESIIDKIMMHVNETRTSYVGVLEKMGINLNEEYLFCELDGHGTSQNYLNRIFNSELDGYYLVYEKTEEVFPIKVCSVSCWHKELYEYNAYALNEPLLETVFSSPEPSICDIDVQLNYQFEKEVRTSDEIQMMLRIQERLLNKVMECADIISFIDDYSDEYTEAILSSFSSNNCQGQINYLNKCILNDEITGATFRMNRS